MISYRVVDALASNKAIETDARPVTASILPNATLATRTVRDGVVHTTHGAGAVFKEPCLPDPEVDQVARMTRTGIHRELDKGFRNQTAPSRVQEGAAWFSRLSAVYNPRRAMVSLLGTPSGVQPRTS